MTPNDATSATTHVTAEATVPPADEPEFSAEENALFNALGMRMHFVGLFALGLGLVAVLVGLSRKHAGAVLAGVLYAIIGYWTTRAGAQFRSTAWTKGHDHSHLMAALVALRKLYTLQYWICLIALVAVLVVLGVSSLY